MEPARLIRAAVAACLVLGGVLTVVSISTMPDFSGGFEERLEAVAAGPLSTLSAYTWVLSQLVVTVGLLGLTHLLRMRVPVLAALSGILILLSGFGHAVYGGVNITMLAMAEHPEDVEAHVAVLDRLESGLGVPFMAMGMLGLVLGFLLLAVALWRSGVGPRWAGPAVVVWLVLEFVGSALSSWAFYGSGLLYLVLFGTFAATVARSSTAVWRSEAEATAEPATVPVPV
jgi:hypothetical protein